MTKKPAAGGARKEQRGSIQPRGPDKWFVRVYLGRDAEGNRNYASKTVRGSKADALKELTKLQHQSDIKAVTKATGRTTVSAFLAEWLTSKVGIEPKTRSEYESRIKQDLQPYLGPLRLSQVEPSHVRRWVTWMVSERKVSRRTIEFSKMILRQAFSTAVDDGVLPKNPVRHIELPEQQHTTTMRPLTPDEGVEVLNAAETGEDPYYPLWHLFFNSGLRPQEALAVQWPDLEGDRISIRRVLKQVRPGHYEVREAKAKTKGSLRTIRLPKETLEVLEAHRKRQVATMLQQGAAYQRLGFIFSTAQGGFLDIANVRRAWRKALKRAGIDPKTVRLYDGARHTHATALLSQNVHPKVVSERLGHSDIRVTLNTYSHVLPEMDSEAAALSGSLFSHSRKAAQG